MEIKRGEKMSLNNLRKEYARQDSRATAYPIYVTVQELICIGVISDGYSVICPYGDGVTKRETIEDKDGIKEMNLGYIWRPVEFFLTVKGAQRYIKANAHNHGELRIYIHHFGRCNFEMLKLLKELKFKTGFSQIDLNEEDEVKLVDVFNRMF